MRHQDYRTYLLLVAACALGTACSCAKQYSASSAVSCNPFEQLTSIAATVPRIVSPASSGGAVLLGYVADSATRNGLSGAMVSFIRRAGNGVATPLQRTPIRQADSQFVFRSAVAITTLCGPSISRACAIR